MTLDLSAIQFTSSARVMHTGRRLPTDKRKRFLFILNFKTLSLRDIGLSERVPAIVRAETYASALNTPQNTMDFHLRPILNI